MRDPCFEFLMFPHTGSLDRAQFYPPAEFMPIPVTPARNMLYLFRDVPENTRMIPAINAF